jgi:hypothetical protein
MEKPPIRAVFAVLAAGVAALAAAKVRTRRRALALARGTESDETAAGEPPAED